MTRQVRAARPDDAERVEQIVRAAYGPFEALIDRTPAPMLDDYPALIADGHVHVLEGDGDDDQAVPGGVLGAIVAWREGGDWYVDNVAVDPALHGSGVGSMLLAASEEQARRAGIGRVWLYTNVVMTSNVGFYERRGYRVFDRRLDRGYDRIFLEKTL